MTRTPRQMNSSRPAAMQDKQHAGWVLLRGLARECRHWGNFPERLAAHLGQPVRCLELPGNGTGYQQKTPVTITAMLEQIRQQAGLQAPVNVLGLSMGGMIAAEWALRYPQEVRGLVLVNSSSTLSPPWQRMRMTALPHLLLALILPRAQRESLVYRLTCTRRDDQRITLRQWIRYANQYPTSHVNFLRQLIAAARYRVAGASPVVTPLVLCSRGDRLVNPACSHILAQHWRIQADEHPWAGHDLPHDAPDWLLHKLAGYLGH
ncbi:alpha/beta hydrolase [Oceanimonas baumannii]|uniref:alpha/beta fold hydrolase n=1 Tax=Oceanimonas baumannii TaxID=129578 RepID=UPI001D19240B|nr:alpha/beta hydrolase [Oceanimonas baumannii]MCC4263287.1 alpha/beta hydrolase [Oceanimonas baumannii]